MQKSRSPVHGNRCRAGVLFAFVWLVACGEPDGLEDPVDTATAPTPQAGFLPEAAPTATDCGENGRLETELFGALATPVDWTAADLSCDGMPRPEGAGARLRFAGALEDGRSLAVIIALPGLERAATAAELPSNVTLIEEGAGRFYSTPGLESCWTDVLAQTDLADGRYRIDGKVYCISPLVEINGDASVTIRELVFSGQLDWDAT